MKPEQLWYTYVDFTDCGHAFYVGKGCDVRVSDASRNSKHDGIARYHGLNRSIVFATWIEEAALEAEVEFIRIHETYVHEHPENEWACNFTLGGDGMSGHKHDDAARMKMSLAKKGKVSFFKGKKRPGLAQKLLGKPLSLEHKRSISIAKTGSILSDEHRRSIGAGHIGTKRSDEHRRNMSLARIGRPQPNISAAKKGKKFSEEHRLAISKAKKGNPSPHRGLKRPSEFGRRVSEALKGKPSPNKGKAFSATARQNMSKAKITEAREHVLRDLTSIRERLARGEKRKNLAVEYDLSYSHFSYLIKHDHDI